MCILGCSKCANSTLVCEECLDGYWLSQGVIGQGSGQPECKKSCSQGPFTDQTDPKYAELAKLNYEPYLSTNECGLCPKGCQKCRNITLECEDKMINYLVKEGSPEGDFSQVAILAKFLDPFKATFSLPTNRDYSYLLKISTIQKASEASVYDYNNNVDQPNFLRRQLSSPGFFEFVSQKLLRLLSDGVGLNSQLTLMNTWHSENQTLSANSPVPKELQHHQFFDLEIESNGIQFLVDSLTKDSYVITQEKKKITVRNNKVALPEDKYKTKSDLALSIKDSAKVALAATEGLSLLGMSSAGSSGSMVMRFTQILKVYNRLKYIGVHFGESLDNFLIAIGEIFSDSETDPEKIDLQRKIEKGWKGKISNFRVYGEFGSNLGFKIYVYFALKLITMAVNSFAVPAIKSKYRLASSPQNEANLKSLLGMVKVVNLIRYLNFVVFNIVVVDGCFFASRIILHLSELHDPET